MKSLQIKVSPPALGRGMLPQNVWACLGLSTIFCGNGPNSRSGTGVRTLADIALQNSIGELKSNDACLKSVHVGKLPEPVHIYSNFRSSSSLSYSCTVATTHEANVTILCALDCEFLVRNRTMPFTLRRNHANSLISNSLPNRFRNQEARLPAGACGELPRLDSRSCWTGRRRSRR